MKIKEEDLVELFHLADKAENLVKNGAAFLAEGDWIGWTPGGRLQTARKLMQQAHEDIRQLLEQMRKLEEGTYAN